MLTFQRKVTTAHDFVFELFVGPVPKGFELHHWCQVKKFCNRDHLEVVSPRKNRRIHLMTSCQRGHEMTPENTILGKNGLRQCRACKNEAHKRWLAQHPGYATPYKRAY